MLLSEAAERSHTSGQRLAWERARLGTRLIATHELVIEDRSSNDHAYLTYLIEPATSQSALRCLSAVLCRVRSPGWTSARQYLAFFRVWTDISHVA